MQWETLLNPTIQPIFGASSSEELLLAQLMGVRLIKRCGIVQRGPFHDMESLAAWLGQAPFTPELLSDPNDAPMHLCEEWLKQAPQRRGAVDVPLVRFCQRLADLLGLNATERDILVFTWLKLRHEPLRDLHDGLSVNDHAQHVALLAELIGHTTNNVAMGLQPGARLACFGLLERPKRSFMSCEPLPAGGMLYRLAPLLLEDPSASHTDDHLREVLLQLCPRQPGGRWPLVEFPQVPRRQLLVDYLKRALGEGRHGANVLIHGAPGVGKTELTRTLADILGAVLYAVPAQDGQQQPIEPKERLGRYRVAQRLVMSKPRSMVLFDEVEDALAGGLFLPKAWTNQLLEDNPVPGLWLTNQIDWLDPAFLRRFDLIIELKPNHHADATAALERRLQALPVLPEVRQRLARQSWMSPALASQLIDLAVLLPPEAPLRNQEHLKGLLASRLSALGHPVGELGPVFETAVTCHSTPSMPAYRLEWLNTHPGLDQLVQRLTRRGRGRLCLYGPPGTGKTALAKHLAEILELPLITASASSLLDRYVGGTEQRIGELFYQARVQNAVLLIDEIDSLLMSRTRASQSWEVSHTNELLVQIEAFTGILLATTNRIDSLGRAVMRRFDLKVGFDHLTSLQLREVLRAVLPDRDHRRLDAIPDSHLAQRRLTPGNVQTALDQLDLRGLSVRLNHLLEALADEEREQQGEGRRQPIGFLH